MPIKIRWCWRDDKHEDVTLDFVSFSTQRLQFPLIQQVLQSKKSIARNTNWFYDHQLEHWLYISTCFWRWIHEQLPNWQNYGLKYLNLFIWLTYSLHNYRASNNLKNIVANNDPLQTKRLSIFHESIKNQFNHDWWLKLYKSNIYFGPAYLTMYK